MLDDIFMQVIDMSRIASISILIVLIARVLLKRFPKFISYALWAVVLFRLLCPVSFESMISLIPETTPTSYHYTLAEESISIVGAGEAAYQAVGDAVNGGLGVQHIKTTELDSDGNVKVVTSSWWEVWILFGQYIWFIGIGIMLMYSIISYNKVRKKVKAAIPLRENIYMVDDIISPFVMGVFQPKIYLPSGLGKREQEYIILHEQFHIKRLDHIVKLLAFVALCIHWFNPLVWLAFVLFSKDMEMSCDEAVIKRMGEDIRADYSASLLALATGHRIIRGLPLAFGEGDTKGRIKNLAGWKMPNKKRFAIVTVGVIILIICLLANPISPVAGDTKDVTDASTEIHVSMDLEEHYITNTGNPSNSYYIDENHVLWGYGRNDYGQLGQGTQDYGFHSEMVKIAEDVVHVDYSQTGFVIYLTKDNKLYGLGKAGCGNLEHYEIYEWHKHLEEDVGRNYISKPYLIMENVIYARCGREDIAILTEDQSVWITGTVYSYDHNTPHVYFTNKPEQVLENAVLVTGGRYNHAALLEDGTVWTWGYNYTGNCGVENMAGVLEPTQVADGVVMVWTDIAQNDIDCTNMTESFAVYPDYLENTVIKKADGSYWICGANVGTKEKLLPNYFEVENASMICTHEFLPIENTAISMSWIKE